MFAVTIRTFDPTTRTATLHTLREGFATVANARTWAHMDAKRTGQPLDHYRIVGPEAQR